MSYLKFQFNGQEMVIDSLLAETVASVVWNTKKDSDGVFIIAGDRMVGTGKSVIAQTMAAFSSFLKKKWNMNDDSFQLSNIHFDSQEMVDDVLKKPKMSDFIYDEAYNALSTGKTFTKAQNDILDFFTECRFKNNVYYIVLPDFFDLKENIAVARSEVLINVYRTSHVLKKDFIGDGVERNLTIWERGQFKCWNRQAKNLMYDFFRTTRRKSYSMVKPTFPPGQFTNQFPFGKEEYEKMKYDALMRFKSKRGMKDKTSDGKPLSGRQERAMKQRDMLIVAIKKMHPEMGDNEIGGLCGLTRHSVLDAKQALANGV